jgi:HEAT repeat protein
MSEHDSNNPGFWALVMATKDGPQRQAARENLVAMGNEATPVLLRLLEDPNPTVRWEAALALKETKDPSAAEALAEAMEDENGDVRWVAAEALAAIGTPGLRSLLKILRRDADSFELRDAAHVAISLLKDRDDRDAMAGVYRALKNGTSPEVVIMEAAQALEVLDRRTSQGA